MQVKSIREQITEAIIFNIRNTLKDITYDKAINVSFKVADQLGLNNKLGDTRIKLIHAIGIGAEVESNAKIGK